MISINQSFSHLASLEQTLRETRGQWIVLGQDHEAIRVCYSMASDCGEIDYGLGVATASVGIEPKAIFAPRCNRLFVGFDSFVAAVSQAHLGSAPVSRERRLDGAFLALTVLPNDDVCVVHELGALVLSADLEKKWAVATDVLAEWSIDVTSGELSITEADTGYSLRVSLADGRRF